MPTALAPVSLGVLRKRPKGAYPTPSGWNRFPGGQMAESLLCQHFAEEQGQEVHSHLPAPGAGIW